MLDKHLINLSGVGCHGRDGNGYCSSCVESVSNVEAYFDYQGDKNCTRCLPGFNISTGCTTCLAGRTCNIETTNVPIQSPTPISSRSEQRKFVNGRKETQLLVASVVTLTLAVSFVVCFKKGLYCETQHIVCLLPFSQFYSWGAPSS